MRKAARNMRRHAATRIISRDVERPTRASRLICSGEVQIFPPSLGGSGVPVHWRKARGVPC